MIEADGGYHFVSMYRPKLFKIMLCVDLNYAKCKDYSVNLAGNNTVTRQRTRELKQTLYGVY
jgi:hypothetical protein